MNEQQIKILALFDTAMQSLVNVWEDESTTPIQLAMAYGGASIMLMLARATTDIDKQGDHAAMLLNQAAEQLGMPQLNK